MCVIIIMHGGKSWNMNTGLPNFVIFPLPTHGALGRDEPGGATIRRRPGSPGPGACRTDTMLHLGSERNRRDYRASFRLVRPVVPKGTQSQQRDLCVWPKDDAVQAGAPRFRASSSGCVRIWVSVPGVVTCPSQMRCPVPCPFLQPSACSPYPWRTRALSPRSQHL